MARAFAYFAFDFDGIDIFRLFRAAFDRFYTQNQPFDFAGRTYDDRYFIDYASSAGPDRSLGLLGNDLTINRSNDALTGGTVRALVDYVLQGDEGEPALVLDGVAIAARALNRVGATASVADDRALLAAALGGADTFSLSNGADRARGFGGNDAMFGFGGADRLFGGAGADRVLGEGGNDVLHGEAGDDALTGGEGADALRGGVGADVLTGGPGADRLHGGADGAADRFVFSAASQSRPGAGRDAILDFDRGLDVVVLRGIDARPGTAADDAFAWSGQTPRAFSAWWADAGPDVVLRADATGDGRADLEVRLAGLQGLSAADAIL